MKQHIWKHKGAFEECQDCGCIRVKRKPPYGSTYILNGQFHQLTPKCKPEDK